MHICIFWVGDGAFVSFNWVEAEEEDAAEGDVAEREIGEEEDERERNKQNKKNSEKNVWWGEREKIIFFFF
jgi:hypothetical protein